MVFINSMTFQDQWSPCDHRCLLLRQSETARMVHAGLQVRSEQRDMHRHLSRNDVSALKILHYLHGHALKSHALQVASRCV